MTDGNATDELVPTAGTPTSTGGASWKRVAVAEALEDRRKGANALNDVRRGLGDDGDEGEVGATTGERLVLAAAVAVDSLGKSGSEARCGPWAGAKPGVS